MIEPGLQDETTVGREATPSPWPFEPLPDYTGVLRDEPVLAANGGKRIGILVVAYNALTTLTAVFKRITPNVWNNVEEVVVFDDASPDETYVVEK